MQLLPTDSLVSDNTPICDVPTRRSFISKSAVTVAGALMTIPEWAGAQAATRTVRVGIVSGHFGLGFQFHEHPGGESLKIPQFDAKA